MFIKDGEDHGEKILSFKQPLVTFRKDPSAKTLQAQDVKGFLPLLAGGKVRIGQHVRVQFCWQIYEVADFKKMGQLTAAKVQRSSGRLLQIWGVKLGESLTLSIVLTLHRVVILGILTCNIPTRLDIWTPVPMLL